MYALKKYIQVTEEDEFLFDEGVEMLVEDRAALAVTRVYSFQKGRPVLHPLRDRSRRIQHGGRQQRVYEPHGEGEPPLCGRDGGARA